MPGLFWYELSKIVPRPAHSANLYSPFRIRRTGSGRHRQPGFAGLDISKSLPAEYFTGPPDHEAQYCALFFSLRNVTVVLVSCRYRQFGEYRH